MCCRNRQQCWLTSQLHVRVCELKDLLNPSDELWTEAPVESDEEDAALVEAIQVRAEEDQEDADDSVQHVPMYLKEARELFARGSISSHWSLCRITRPTLLCRCS